MFKLLTKWDVFSMVLMSIVIIFLMIQNWYTAAFGCCFMTPGLCAILNRIDSNSKQAHVTASLANVGLIMIVLELML